MSCRCVLTNVPGGYPLSNVDIELVRTDTMAIVQVVQTNKAGEARFTAGLPAPCFFRPRIIGKNWNLQVTDPGLGYSLYDRVVAQDGLGTDLTFTSAIAALAATGGTIGARSGDYHEGAILTIPTTKNYVIEGIGHGILEDVSYTPVMGVQIHNPAGAGGFDGVIFHVDTGARLTLRGVEVHQDRNYVAIEAHGNPWIILEGSYVHSDGTAAAIKSSYQVRVHRSVVTCGAAAGEVIDVATAIVYLECSESRLTGAPLINGSFGVCVLEKVVMTGFTCDTLSLADGLRIVDCRATGGILLTGGQHTDLTITGNQVAFIAVGYDAVGGTAKRVNISNNLLSAQYSFDVPPFPPAKFACIALHSIQGLTCVGNVGVAELHALTDTQYVVECWGNITYSEFAANTWDGLPVGGDVIDAVYGPGIPSAMIAGAGGDHGALTGLLDDDHTQYVLRSILTTNGDLFVRSAGVIDRIAAVIPAGPALMNVLGIVQGDTLPGYKAVLDDTNPADVAAVAGPGTSLVFSHRDHVHAHPNLGDLHTGYLLADGTRALSGNWNPGAHIIGNYDFTARPGTLYVGDVNFELYLEAGGPVITFDTGLDFLGYVRASNYFNFSIGGVEYMRIGATGILVDHILELAAGHGVEIDGCLIKDGRAALALGLRTTTGPTDLIVGAVVDGEYLKRVGATIVSGAPGGGGGGDDVLALAYAAAL